MKVVVLIEGVHEDKLDDEGKIIGCTEICGAITLLKAENEKEENIIVDTGNRGFEQEIITALKKEGLKPEDVGYVINTHSHFDHLANNYLFKNAKVTASGIWFNNPDRSLDLIEPANIPGIEIISTPGHAPSHISVIVKSEGKTYVIAGDAMHERYIKEGLVGFPPNQDYIDSAKKIVDMADVIIPGHGRVIQGNDLEELKQAVYKMEVK
ncbi:MBL fold metallo-hydrolase [Candidatus Woesearchaeota archaeon]|nr:MBL fold metallo-hydrolase [Candidatus Woesearchaeota archaeon]